MSESKVQQDEEVTQTVMDKETQSSNKNSKGDTKSKKSAKSNDFFAQIDDYLHDFLVERAPKLPENVRETIVRYMPIINMISIIITLFAAIILVPLIFALLGLTVFTSGVYGYGYLGQVNGLGIVLSLALYGFILYFQLKAQVGLQPKLYQAWKNLIFAQLFAAISSVLSFSLVGLFFNIVWLYFLYQVKGYYKTK
jgi:hypothetical protein